MHARELLPILAVVAVTSARAFAAETQLVELGSSIQHADGFRVKLDVVKFPSVHEGRKVPPLSFTAEVPRRVGRTQLGIVWLEMERGDRGSALITPIERRDRGETVRCSVDAEERSARQCVLHFQYAPIGDPGRWVKDYVLRLKYHLTPTQ